MRKLKTCGGLLAASLLMFMTSVACNVDDGGEEQPLSVAGESCMEDERCASGLCLSDLDQCADTCSESEPCSGSDVCEEGFCVAPTYCDEGFGPACPRTECEQACGENGYCNRQAEGGAICVCDTGFEGDGFNCQPAGFDPCAEDNGGCGNTDLFICTAEGEPGSGELVAACTPVNPCLDDNGACGDSRYYQCDNPEPGVAECSLIDLCETNNGGCGDPEVFQCATVATDEGSEVECLRTLPCTEDNGGCGDPGEFLCRNVDTSVTECVLVNPCTDDNGGCGDPIYNTCENPEPGEVTCGLADLCDVDNGGCGPAAEYACVPNLGADPGCWYIGGCEETVVVNPSIQATVMESSVSNTYGGFWTMVNPAGYQTDLRRSGLTLQPDGDIRSYYLFDINTAAFTVDDLWSASLVLNTLDWDTYANLPPEIEVLLSATNWDSSMTWFTQPYSDNIRHATMAIDPAGAINQTLSNPTRALANVLKSSLASDDSVSILTRSLGLAGLFSVGGTSLELNVLTCDHIRPGPEYMASVSGLYPTQPYNNGTLDVGRDQSEVYMRFQLDLPPGATITSARLDLTVRDLYETNQPSDFILDYSTEDTWGDFGLTYDIRPAPQNAVLGRFTVDPEEFDRGNATVTVETFELTEVVRQRYAADGLVTLRIAADAPGLGAAFVGRLSPGESPVLRVTYE